MASSKIFGLDTIKIIILLHRIYASAQDLADCSNQKIDVHPVVQIYDASEEDIVYANGSVKLKEPVGLSTSVAGWPGMECKHSKAIRWVFNLNYFAGMGDTYAAQTREVENFYDPTTYTFKADVEIQLYKKNLRFVMTCMSYDNICDRSSVEISYNRTERAYTLRTLNQSEENGTLVRELEKKVFRDTKYWKSEGFVNLEDSPSCTVNFSMNDQINQVFFQFEPAGEFNPPRTLPSRLLLESVHLDFEYLSPKCLSDFCDKENNTCYTLPKNEKRTYWPTIFVMTDNEKTHRIVHAYQTLKSRDPVTKAEGPGTFKFAWEYSDKRDFLDVVKLPEKVYVNEKMKITCKISPFMFSFGTKIAFQVEIDGKFSEITFLNDEEVEEPETFLASRVAMGSKVFQSVHLKGDEANLTVYCFSPVVNSSTEWVNASRTATLKVPRHTLSGSKDGNVFELRLSSSFNTSCISRGPPLPKLSIQFPGNNSRVNVSETIMDGTIIKTMYIPYVDESHARIYNCVSTNPNGILFHTFEIKIDKSDVGVGLSQLTIILISVFGSLSAIFLAIVVILLVRFRMEKEEFRRLTEEAVREFQNGMDASLVNSSEEGSGGHMYANDSIKTLPYERKYEVSSKLWTINNTLLGAGAFGLVRKGTVEIGSRKSVIAVKTVKSPDDIENFKATLLELKIMAHVGYHRHIVKLVAASTEEIQNRKVFIGVEFCANGNLLNYLQKRKKLFTNFVKNGEINFPEQKEDDASVSAEEGVYENLVVTSDISTIDLYKWSFQIASGLDFLESKKVLHADLAARNILLTEELVVKISDFGLSRDLFENSEYTKRTQVALPWKWMAIESLKYLKFSTKSDVWSYGVTLHEVFTLGEEPYAGQSWTTEFVEILENGMRLDRPEFGTHNLHAKILMPCWRAEPSERISFTDAMSFFEKAIGLLTASPRNNKECCEFC